MIKSSRNFIQKYDTQYLLAQAFVHSRIRMSIKYGYSKIFSRISFIDESLIINIIFSQNIPVKNKAQ